MEKNSADPEVLEVNDTSSGILQQTPSISEDYDFVRGLKARQISLFALGGAIGTGLFVGSASSLQTCGPAAVWIAYIMMSFFVWIIMQMLCEMITYCPLAGESTTFAIANRYGSKTLGFVTGWNLFYAQLLGPPAEITACALVIEYWDPNTKLTALWISICFILLLIINYSPVKVFGEVEFWIASLKIICLVGLIILGIVLFFGGGPEQHGVLGFHYWKDGNAFKEHLVAGSTGRFLAVVTAIIKSGFSFILSPELITSAAAEAQNPRKVIPKASSRFIYRLIFFYIVGILVLGVICDSNDTKLATAISAGESGAAASGFVIAIQNAGIHGLNHVINAVVLTSAFSSANAGVYACSRTAHSMCVRGAGPKQLAKVNTWGIPIYCVGIAVIFLALAYLNCSDGAAQVFNWLSNICTISGFISWVLISITYIRFRKAITYHGCDDRVPYRVKGMYYGAYACIFWFVLLTFINGYSVFFPENWSGSNFVAAYITIPVIIVLFVVHTIYQKKIKIFYDLSEVDVITGVEQCEREAAEAEIGKTPMTIPEKIWDWLF
ncbi:hypothetical protein CANARDRAFT_9117 [[Candida] arabinofermentans NRRL YB-2248]|uniref:Amino acid permease/ SLC12A domain-containing protein n=1 Tax=[Candida] arabinofermentans NRRL YB-2248 TaxID=983967 RepID=A0A1E4SWD8_9ASCO|nr:hypothetical protein CANARDRAFT_9117 [[Candida] arabinofermentans NRRL YB-2248]